MTIEQRSIDTALLGAYKIAGKIPANNLNFTGHYLKLLTSKMCQKCSIFAGLERFFRWLEFDYHRKLACIFQIALHSFFNPFHKTKCNVISQYEQNHHIQ